MATDGSAATNFNQRAIASVEFTDAQRPIVVKKTLATFVITLPSNPTTGFSWVLKNFDSSLVKPISRVYLPPTKSSLIGKGGCEQWKFAVTAAGFRVPHSTSITLVYSRPWELEGAQIANFKVITQP